MPRPPLPPLAIDAVLPRLLDALRERGTAVLQAPPGAGKTTRVPLALLEQPWLPGHRIVVVEPHGLAARAAAFRMAALLGEEVGGTVGFHDTGDTRIGTRTRVELVTGDLFLRRIQDSPELPDVGAVLFDAFHERRIAASVALTFAREARDALHGNTLLLAMSAAMDAGPVSALLGSASAPAPVVTGGAYGFPVEVRHLDAPAPGAPIEDAVASTVRRALREESGGVLAFLPDDGAVRRLTALLEWADSGPDTLLVPLFDEPAPDALDAAIAPPPPGMRKLVLATSLAETGLTADGVRIVVDGGLTRVPRLDPRSGMTHPVTVPVSRAEAEWRSAAAGRLEPGVCYRLWPHCAHAALAPCAAPEILGADLLPLALELAAWGVRDGADPPWLDAPPPAAMARARALLEALGATDAAGTITPDGKRMAHLGLHPRLARLILSGADMGLGALACTAAAVLDEAGLIDTRRDNREAELRLWIGRLLDLERGAPTWTPGGSMDQDRAWRILSRAQLWRRRIGNLRPADDTGDDREGELLALAYPDLIAPAPPTQAPPAPRQDPR